MSEIGRLTQRIEQLERQALSVSTYSRNLIPELEEWVEYTLDRANKLATGNDPFVQSDEAKRLRAKAGCFRSLAYEVQRIIPRDNNQKPAQQ